MSINHQAKAAAMNLIQKIEGQIDPFDVATGGGASMGHDIGELVHSLGGRRDPREMTPAGTAMYILALLVANSE